MEQPTDDEVKTLCKIGQGKECCRYLTVSSQGWGCEKHTDLARLLDRRVMTMNAQGDNCEGKH